MPSSGKDFEAVARKIKLANDFGAKQRHDVGTFGKQKTGNNFFGDGSAAENVAAFENEHFLAGFGQIGGVDKTVMAAADDDYVVVLRHAEKLR